MRKRCRQNDFKVMRIIDDIDVTQLDLRSIMENAISYSPKSSDKDGYFEESDLKKRMVNSIRHEGSNYDHSLRKLNRIYESYSDRQLHYHMIKNSTLTKISNLYPFLRNECDSMKCTVNMICAI